jgi:hypothetical protein
MASLERRIEDLEGRIEPPTDESQEVRRRLHTAITDELGRLKAARARGHYRGGNPPRPIQPTDPAGEVLGYPYTQGQVTELAIRRVFEREAEKAPDTTPPETTEELVNSWAEGLRDLLSSLGMDWDEVVAWGPPEPTPPWHGRLGLGRGQ